MATEHGLLPCPFCSSDDLSIYHGHRGNKVKCHGCGVSGVLTSIWNHETCESSGGPQAKNVTKATMAARIQNLELQLDRLIASHADLIEYAEGMHSSVDVAWARRIERSARTIRNS